MAVKIEDLAPGTKVHYQPEHYADDEFENGIVKTIRTSNESAVFVVFNCGGEWDRYEEYTSALTNIDDLHIGWRT